MSDTKNPIGRPSELEPTLAKAKEYLLGGYKDAGEVIPNIAGLACYVGKARSTIYEYAEQSKDFSDILDGIMKLQESKLLNEGLKGNFNPTITKLILTKHGYSDRIEQELSGSVEKPITIIERKIVDTNNSNA